MADRTTIEGLSELLTALADPTRLRLLSLLLQNGETCVCDLTDATGLNQTTVSRHLGTLRHAALVQARREGLWVHYSLARGSSELPKELAKLLKRSIEEIPQLQKDLKNLQAANPTCCGKPVQKA